MKYVPDLIPDSRKVLPDYFKGSIYTMTKKNPFITLASWVFGVFFFIGALSSVSHLPLMLVFACIGLIIIPPGQPLIERKLKFKLTSKIKLIAASALFVLSVPLTGYYKIVDEQIALQQKIADEQAAKEKYIADEKEEQRKDSLAFYMNLSKYLASNHKIKDAHEQLQLAAAFAALPIEKEQINKAKSNLDAITALELVKAKKYQAALDAIDNLLNSDPSNTELRYHRAICYSKTGSINEAVSDLKMLISSGHSDAEKLHDKINPVRKRISYYVTLCWDGTTSSSNGRGACSHHGGVKNWREPIYEEYRQYE